MHFYCFAAVPRPAEIHAGSAVERSIMKKIIVLFKTHLDVGFTNFSEEVVRRYNEEYIPGAISVGEKLKDSKEGFVWTTGSWLIWQYLKTASPEKRERMERAISDGIISWHGLPTTLHSEISSPELFEYGLSLSKELDERYSKHTTGAKYTDVPGHTIGIVPLMAKAGIKLLHIGVNSASTPPDCPDLFRWQAANGSEIIVMYNKGNYGEFTEIPGTETGVLFAHTNDNCGPQSADEIIRIYKKLHKDYPGAEIKAGNLNDVAELVSTIKDTLPVFDGEIGDTWIHGAGTDPRKMNGYRALLRAAESWSESDKKILYESLIMIPEHTWGLDEKTHLGDHKHFSREKFDKARRSEKFLKMEKSWQEQRNYLTKNLSKLSADAKIQAEAALEQYKKEYPELSGYEKITGPAVINGWNVEISENGALARIAKGEKEVKGSLCRFMYEAFSEDEVNAFGGRYITNRFDWALEDFGKIGLRGQMDQYVSLEPKLEAAYVKGNKLLLELACEEWAFEKLGCPVKLTLEAEFHDSGIEFDFAWFNKPASRIPEALWLQFDLGRMLESLGKLGIKVDPRTVISKGNREMHCTDGSVFFEGAKLYAADSPLVSIEKPFVYGFYNNIPSMDKGIWVNLFNNQWGTNFPMWNEGDARFRFALEF